MIDLNQAKARVALTNDNIENFMVAATPGGIEAQEAQGQQAMVTSSILPLDAPWDDMVQIGIERGQPVDELFVSCALPAGWRRIATEHSMWSDIVDDKGRKRASIFYKAAFYDRRAYMSLECRYTVSVEPVLGWAAKDYRSGGWVALVKDAGTVIWASSAIEPEPDYNADRDVWHNWLDRKDALADAASNWLIQNYSDYKNPTAYWD